MMQTKTVHILLVEDDRVDVKAVERTLKQQKIANPLTVVSDGVEALEALRGQSTRQKIPRPYIILLDLNRTQCTDGPRIPRTIARA